MIAGLKPNHDCTPAIDILKIICYNIFVKKRKELSFMFDDFDTMQQIDEYSWYDYEMYYGELMAEEEHDAIEI